MLETDFCRTFDLRVGLSLKIGDHGRSHGAGSPYLGLTAGFRAGNRRIVLNEVADQPSYLQAFDQLAFRIAQIIGVMVEQGRDHAAAAHGRRCHDDPSGRVLFAGRIGIACEQERILFGQVIAAFGGLIESAGDPVELQGAGQHAGFR